MRKSASFEQKLLAIISDGQFHSGQDIANELDVSRTAVWKAVNKLKGVGADIYCVQGKGYKLSSKLDLIEHNDLYKRLSSIFCEHNQILIFTDIASTNRYLSTMKVDSAEPYLCVAEYQSEGRGRRGREWHSPFARNIYMSLRCRLPVSIHELSGLSLTVGCSIAESLKTAGVSDIQLKWPNDLRLYSKKVGGILIETISSNMNSTDIVIGVGLNWDMPDNNVIDQPWINIKPFSTTQLRGELIGSVITKIWNDLVLFSEKGFGEFKEKWDSYDEYSGKTVNLLLPNQSIKGIYKEVLADGTLLLQTAKGETSFSAGEISLREEL
ncbi:bifunctional biotin--[acetyl-CoA-carboxylase] ligase/biotin operon repressor BirA [Pleionea sp. CnH1-48]|uniref:bifunctional biotin--[acetyl-CoA-carboxylase] ligase/biotin operon repressor BirA n=1 Tax=Pleionea sp. CnH1-48 TaxID=2954494 RepID=UPI002096CFAC|nr:bifunctional biotin--[acetyl-CoA-carboxylase] ligase/biotin operon repressor BirA [Pleionea sp. CnH1-48]MCO7225019.1 bifunctional biotin--[acetyl-CoA-carboxylase] ligase/biotin operon repressor BirA [Pleionea sp. CnH1-48]